MKSRIAFLAVTAMFLLTFAAFRGTTECEFVNFDDDKFVLENPRVNTGISWNGLRWAATATELSNWHPLTWASHMLDVEFFGLHPRGHHFTSLLIHAVNGSLLFLVLWGMTGARWRSFIAASLFAIHPLRVESVAWVAERKDVLSSFFFLVAMWGYCHYVKRPSVGRYTVLFCFFALGLMAKPMVVTLPFVLLLLDWWPLGRWSLLRSSAGAFQHSRVPGAVWLAMEKVPLVLLSLLSIVLTMFAQERGGAVFTLEAISLPLRLGNALVSYVSYLGKMLWPAGLAVFYPHPVGGLPSWKIAASGLLLALLTTVVLRQGGKRPYAAVGWFWYVGMLLPVIGIVQVGSQAMADRYTYLPMVGILVLLVWMMPDFRMLSGSARLSLTAATGLLVVGFGVATWMQVVHWKNSLALWERAVDVSSGHGRTSVPSTGWVMYNNLGNAHFSEGRLPEALAMFAKASKLRPSEASPHYNLGNVYFALRQYNEAADAYLRAVAITPSYAQAFYNLGNTYAALRRYAEAVKVYRMAVEVAPLHSDAYYNMGNAYLMLGMVPESRWAFGEAARLEDVVRISR
ncbi:tetratricopeptide repeat protein [bacterium]|nr:tetratricopeptide repeat protein [bacterium]